MARRKLPRSLLLTTTNYSNLHKQQNDAAEQQPWRCCGCGKAVRPHRQDPCGCYPDGFTEQALESKRKSNES